MTTPSRCVSHASTAACTQGATATTVTGWSVCPTHTGRQGSTHRSAPGATHSAGHATTASGYSGAVQPHMVAASSDAIPLQHQCLSSTDEGRHRQQRQQRPATWRHECVTLHGVAQSVSMEACLVARCCTVRVSTSFRMLVHFTSFCVGTDWSMHPLKMKTNG